MAINATSESRRSTSACTASSAAGSVGRPRRTAGVVPAMCTSSARLGVWATSGRAATATGRPQRSAHPLWTVMLLGAWCVALFAIDGRASAVETVTKVATRLFLDAATAWASAAQDRAGRNNHDVDLQFLTCVGKTHPRRRTGRGPGCQPVSSRGMHATPGWVAALLVGSHEHAVKPVSVAEVSRIDIADSLWSSRLLLVNG